MTAHRAQRNVAKLGEKYIASCRVYLVEFWAPFLTRQKLRLFITQKVEITTSRFAKLDRLSENEFSPGKESERERAEA